MKKFAPDLAERPQLVAVTKADLTDVREAFPKLRARFKKKKIDARLISAATGEGIQELTRDLYALVKGRDGRSNGGQ
jgi:GTPase